MKKLIIITTAIIRGNYHNYSIGKFYKEYNNILQNYEVYHIINIDKPTNLIKNFTIYETINLFNNIIPSRCISFLGNLNHNSYNERFLTCDAVKKK